MEPYLERIFADIIERSFSFCFFVYLFERKKEWERRRRRERRLLQKPRDWKRRHRTTRSPSRGVGICCLNHQSCLWSFSSAGSWDELGMEIRPVTLVKNYVLTARSKLAPKWRILSVDDPELSIWALNAITDGLLRGQQREISHNRNRKQQYGHRGSDRNGVTTSQGMPPDNRSWEGQEMCISPTVGICLVVS